MNESIPASAGGSPLPLSAPASTWRKHGLLFVVSAPSGAGKTTLCSRIRDEFSLDFSVSCTTRPPRPGEVDGREYYFLTRSQFEEKLQEHLFLEYAEVHGNYYGTLKDHVFRPMQAGRDVLLEIDTLGARQIRKYKDSSLQNVLTDIFIMPASLEQLRHRLEGRRSDSTETIVRRIENAREEIQRWQEFQYTIVSSDKDSDYDRFRAIFLAQACQTRVLRRPV